MPEQLIELACQCVPVMRVHQQDQQSGARFELLLDANEGVQHLRREGEPVLGLLGERLARLVVR